MDAKLIQYESHVCIEHIYFQHFPKTISHVYAMPYNSNVINSLAYIHFTDIQLTYSAVSFLQGYRHTTEHARAGGRASAYVSIVKHKFNRTFVPLKEKHGLNNNNSNNKNRIILIYKYICRYSWINSR